MDSSEQLAPLITIANQLFDLDQKIAPLDEAPRLGRHIERMRRALGELGIGYHSPLGEAYDETRTDCEASIAGTSAHNLRIREVIKPLVYLQEGDWRRILQRALVVVSGE
ncbi:MAG: hypothetical protein OHK0039_33720 [Bacteroidia bacterium]